MSTVSDKSVNPERNQGSEPATAVDPFTAGDAVLDRVKSVAKQITDRVRRLTEDTELDQKALSDDLTETQPPLS